MKAPSARMNGRGYSSKSQKQFPLHPRIVKPCAVKNLGQNELLEVL